MLRECQLYNLHTIGPDEKPPATYPYGNHRRIDYMLGTSMVQETIRRAGYLAYNEGIHSKHRGLFVDFDFQALLGQVDTITQHASRRLKSDDPVSTEKYLAVFKEYVAEHNVRERLDALSLVAHAIPCHQPAAKRALMPLTEMSRALCYLRKKQRKGPLGNMCGPQNFENMVCSLGTGGFVFVNLSAGDNFATRGIAAN